MSALPLDTAPAPATEGTAGTAGFVGTTAASAPRTGALGGLLRLVRPRQWAKNLLVVPLAMLYPETWTAGGVVALAGALAAFTLASAVVYVGNDIADRERDRHHPVKRHRPLASGQVSVPLAIGWGLLLAAALAGLLALAAPALTGPVVGYLALNVAYSYKLKHVPVVDLFLVALGFELRIVAGYVAVGLPLRGWLVPCVFLLCLVLVLGKRRRELDHADAAHRPALGSYTRALIDQLLMLSAGLTATAFLLFLNEDPGQHSGPAVLLLVPMVLLGLFRYLQKVAVSGAGADPVGTLLGDRIIVLAAVLCLVVLVGGRIAALEEPPALVDFVRGLTP